MRIILAVWPLAIISFVLLNKRAHSTTTAPLQDSLETKELNSSVHSGGSSLNYRLPNETYPEHYGIQITTDVHLGKKVFQGEVTIDVVVVNSTNNIVLHARQIEITQVNIVSAAAGETEELIFEYELEREFLTLKRSNGTLFEAGTKWKVTISYNGQLRDDQKGFFLSNYVDENGKDHYVAVTQFSPTDARYAFPCYDEPAKRANFTITINHSPNYTAISNMPVNEKYSSAGKTVFLTTARIPTYIVACVVCDFEYTEIISEGIRQRVYSRSSEKRNHQFSLVSGMLYLKYFAAYYGIPYMIPKLDHVAVRQLKVGGSENWGLPTYTEEDLLYNEKTTSKLSQTDIAKIVAHEMAHQWFGNYVTIQWWSYLWLKEGFASVFAYKAMENVFPQWNVWQGFHVIEYQRALDADAVINSRPLTVDVQKASDIDDIRDEISYYKSASVLLMWQNALGEEVFRRALQNFLKNNQYSAVTEEDLFIELEKSVQIDNIKLPASISKMMKTWTHQGGYPILTVTRNYSEGSFTIQQATFLKQKTLQDSKTWYIPINFAIASNADFRDARASHYLPNISEMKVNAQVNSGDWIILNKRSEYFYRIKYDEENYKLITQALVEQPFKIHARNRAQLLEDTRLLAFSNRLNHEVLLEMLTYLKKEDQYAPWQTASSIIDAYDKLKDTKDFKHFVGDLVRPIFQKLGLNEVPGEHHYDKYTRDIIIYIACEAGETECLVETNKKLKAHLKENITIEPDLEASVFSHGLALADDYEFDEVYQMLMKSPNPSERFLLIYYLSFAQNERHIKKFISSSIDMSNKLLPKERSSLLSRVFSRSEKNLLTCIEFLSENWNAYGKLETDGNGLNPLDSHIRNMANYVLNEKVEKEILALVEKVKNSRHVSESLESVVEKRIASNYRWLQDHGEPILTWISHYMITSKHI